LESPHVCGLSYLSYCQKFCHTHHTEICLKFFVLDEWFDAHCSSSDCGKNCHTTHKQMAGKIK